MPPCLGPVHEPWQPPQPAGDADSLLDCALEALFAERHVEARFAKGVGERAERLPVEGLRRHGLAPRTEVTVGGDAAEFFAERAQPLEQVLPGREAARHEPGHPLRPVPASEVLDDGLRMHACVSVGCELAHRRGPPQPLGAGLQLGEDLLIGVAPPEAGGELGQLGRAGVGRMRSRGESQAGSSPERIDHAGPNAIPRALPILW